MKKIHIVTDSTADLIENYTDQYDIHVVPLTIHIDGETYIDKIDLQPESFMEKMKSSKELPKSSQPATGVFKELYDRLGQDGSEIISIHMTGGMSGTVKSAEAAAQMTDSNVTVIDSMYISHALTFQVVEAAKMASEGKSVKEIVERLKDVRKNTKLFVVVDTLDNLVKGGRVGKGKAMIGSLLNIKPIATLQDGVYTPVGKARSHRQVVSHLFKAFKEETAGKIIRSIGISHANGMAMAGPLLQLIEESGWKDIKFSFTSPIISTHTGEGAIGFMYYTE
ncbi:DegV family protein [Sporosarcina thermotolerans]|uniref:DegV family protein n=1 Tax=Sporosarcina thermotolerans TaxID=633404 RepID=A0AAW9A6R2_9BACL|nr:DegV family protein [Sporosarcina thermotolerans]MDW0115420.1 DegV family protein [Sporosarcina thermotolerans]